MSSTSDAVRVRFLRSLGSRTGRTVGVDHHGPAIDRFVDAWRRGIRGNLRVVRSEPRRELRRGHVLPHVGARRRPDGDASSRCILPAADRHVVPIGSEPGAIVATGVRTDGPTTASRHEVGSVADRGGSGTSRPDGRCDRVRAARPFGRACPHRALRDRAASGLESPRCRAARPRLVDGRDADEAVPSEMLERGAFAARGTFGHSLLATLRIGSREVVSVGPSSTATDRDRNRSRP